VQQEICRRLGASRTPLACSYRTNPPPLSPLLFECTQAALVAHANQHASSYAQPRSINTQHMPVPVTSQRASSTHQHQIIITRQHQTMPFITLPAVLGRLTSGTNLPPTKHYSPALSNSRMLPPPSPLTAHPAALGCMTFFQPCHGRGAQRPSRARAPVRNA